MRYGLHQPQIASPITITGWRSVLRVVAYFGFESPNGAFVEDSLREEIKEREMKDVGERLVKYVWGVHFFLIKRHPLPLPPFNGGGCRYRGSNPGR
jgi:hypothetical protein